MTQMALQKSFLGDGLNVSAGSRLETTRNPKRVVQVRAVATNESRVGVLTPVEREVARKRSMRVGDMAEEMKRMRAQMEDDEQLSSLMRGLRGQNLSDTQFATSDTQMRLIEIDGGNGSDESLPLIYDPVTIANYWGKKPAAVATRVAQLVAVAGGFLSGIAMDFITKKFKENEVKRAIELREIVTSLGPAYIKLGQALSIRPDVLSPSAMTELQKLCDKVPSFPNDIAMALLEEELGLPWTEIYSELSPSPIAAASLGQVYKGRLLENGHVVAVKVQRPYVLETVTVDLFIIRKLGVALRRFPQIATDVVGLVDEWAARFFEELDYIHEGENATRFAAQMAVDLPQVVVPKTYSKYTSRRVLTSEWIEGEKLSQSKASDVGDLVNIGVICYLKQLLDTGLFHADPHPGNLIRTPDGKLAILDFGLMTEITDTQKYGMIEAISHLIHRDYEAIVEDFVALDFIPDGVNLKPIMPVLAKVFDQALEGGGAKNINFQDLAADLAQITFDYPFRIPPYFALIIRAIGVLEGIALVGNPNFAIVDEAYPYIAQRLLTDQNPRLREALRYTIYGKSGVFDADRFIDVMEAFETFTAAARTGGGSEMQGNMASLGSVSALSSSSGNAFWVQQLPPSQNQIKSRAQPGHARAALLFIFSEHGEFFREFILDEVVKGIDAVSREQLAGVMVVLGIDRLRPVLMQSVLPILPGLRPLTYVPTVSAEDETVLNNVNRVMEFLTVGTPASRSTSQGRNLQIYDVVQELLPVLPNVASQLLPQIVNRLVSRVVARALREIALAF